MTEWTCAENQADACFLQEFLLYMYEYVKCLRGKWKSLRSEICEHLSTSTRVIWHKLKVSKRSAEIIQIYSYLSLFMHIYPYSSLFMHIYILI